MRAKEFITEQASGSLMKDVEHTLPASYAIPQLKNQDPYLQYRFGVAMAAAKKSKYDEKIESEYHKETAWGENQVVVSYGEDAGSMIDDALKSMGMPGKRSVSTKNSREVPNVNSKSPVIPFKGYSK